MIALYLRSLRVWAVSAVLFLVWIPAMAVIRLFDRDPLARRTGRSLRLLARTLFRANGGELRVSGAENIAPGQTYVMVSNHQSLVDVLVNSFVPVESKGLARADLFRIPWAGWALRLSKEIPIERADPRNAARALLECARVLRAGCSVLIFAEGTRSADGQLLPFSEGPFQLAIREGVPVLPLVIDGTGRILGKNSLLFQRSRPISLRILPPVSVASRDRKRAPEFRDQVWSQMSAELNIARS